MIGNELYLVKISPSTYQIVNLDIDTNGCLYVIFINEYLTINDLKYIGTVFVNVKNNIIPVIATQNSFIGQNELCIDQKTHDVFQNKYLIYKQKYALWDGIIEKIQFSRTLHIKNQNGFTGDIQVYTIIKE